MRMKKCPCKLDNFDLKYNNKFYYYFCDYYGVTLFENYSKNTRYEYCRRQTQKRIEW